MFISPHLMRELNYITIYLFLSSLVHSIHWIQVWPSSTKAVSIDIGGMSHHLSDLDGLLGFPTFFCLWGNTFLCHISGNTPLLSSHLQH